MKKFSKFFEKFGQGRFISKIDVSKLENYENQFIPEIFDLLKNDGVSSYMNNFLWTLDPSDYIDWLNGWLNMDSNCIPFARTAFADILFICDGKVMVLMSNKGLLGRTTRRVDWFFDRYLTDEGFLEKYFQFSLFGKIGDTKSLKSSECYGFTPLLSLGGEGKLENLKKFQLEEYLLLVSQASDKLDYIEH